MPYDLGTCMDLTFAEFYYYIYSRFVPQPAHEQYERDWIEFQRRKREQEG